MKSKQRAKDQGKRSRIKFNRLATVLSLAALVGCTVGPDYKRPEVVDMPGAYNEVHLATRPSGGSTTLPSEVVPQHPDYLTWWTAFNDPELNSLVIRAVANNPQVAAAEARIREARGNLGIQFAGLFPQVNANGEYIHQRLSDNQPAFGAGSGSSSIGISGLTFDTYQAGFDASWEIDVFGQNRRAIESARDSVQAAVWDRRDVMVSLVAEVAVNYMALRGAQYELAIARQNLQDQQQTLDLTRSKAEGGLIPYLDVAQQEAQVASTASTIPNFETTIRQSIHHLGILLGQDPGYLSAELTPDGPIPVGPAYVPPGLPSELLRRRPDVRRAERQLAAQTAQIGVAVADLFPKFSITGALGLESGTLKQFFDYGSRFYNIAPGVTWDIFDAGKVDSNIVVQKAKEVEALEAYRQAVLQSMQDVEDSLVALNREQVRLQSLREAVAANQRAVDLSTELFEKGSADFLSVLDAQRSLFAAQDAMAQSEETVSANLIGLYKALGGGWQYEAGEAVATK
jgi:outer membrane protein, multidrug efflux system